MDTIKLRGTHEWIYGKIIGDNLIQIEKIEVDVDYKGTDLVYKSSESEDTK